MAPVVVDAHEVRLKAHRPTQKMLRHGRDFDLSKLGIEIGPFEHPSIKLYRLTLVPRRTGLRPVATPAA